MTQTKHNFKRSSICLAVMTATSMGAIAQEKENEKGDLEIIQVTGIKGSLIKSINDKRFSGNISDSINSEDIGKSTDQNIADALGRITGVTVVSNDGEGTQVTVRGADANQNNITLNGQTLTSTNFSQAVDLSSFSADILSKLEVIKTSSADQDEGSLGASVNLVSVRPLDQLESVRSVTLQGRYNDFSEKANHKFQVALSESFLDDTFGVSFTAYDETNAYRKDQYSAVNFNTRQYGQAIDQNGNTVSDIKVIEPANATYELHQNESNRYGGTLGLQYLIGDETEITFDATYSKQKVIRTKDAIQTKSFANTDNWIEGDVAGGFTRPPNPSSDPIEWYQVNTDTYDMTKRLNRYGNGNMLRSDGGDENENFSATLNFKTALTDALRMEAQVGHSSSKADSLPNANTTMENFVQIPGFTLYDAGDNVEPVGVDCTQGDICRMVYGSGISDLGDNLVAYVDADGINRAGNYDNSATTGFNPQDTKSFHLGSIRENDRSVEDSITNAQIDFEYDIDNFGITSIEFGAKATKRTKTVDDQEFTFTSLAAAEVIVDPVTGEVLVNEGGTLTDLRGDIIAGDPIPYDNFMDSLGIGREPATVGWTPIDVMLAKEMVLGSGDIVRDVNNLESRETDIDTKALYFKTNFELLDGKLTGDIGVRYVETEVEARGSSGATYYDSHTLQRDFDRHTLTQLADRSLPECPEMKVGPTGVIQSYDQKYQRVDGLGWDTSAGPDPSTWTPIPDAGPCHDPAFADYGDAVNAFQAGTGPAPNPRDMGVAWDGMWRYADVSTSRTYGWDNLPVWNGDPSGVNTNYSWGSITNNSLVSLEANKTHTYTNLLPSLNLNYQFSDQFIGRFAVSKTMTRPEIDLLRPGYELTEQAYWGGGNLNNGTVRLYNTELEPLESTNLDLSAEWYFSDSGMLSVAYFRKDMSNFADNETGQSLINSVRNPADAPVSGTDLLLNGDDPISGCHPIRATTEFAFWPSDPTTLTDDPTDICANMTVTQVVNSKDATIEGIEIGYMDTFDFIPEQFGLPEWTGGFGVSANYTYQQSEYESGFSSIDPTMLLPSYPVADTPENSYNFTGFWEHEGHQVRLSFRGTSDSLVGIDPANGQSGRTWNQGSIWNDGRNTLDLSATYKVSDDITITFQAINLTDAAYRTYFTSRTLDVIKVDADNAAGFDFLALDEGNPLDGDAPKHRTYSKYKVGATYRLGVRVNF